MGRIYMGVQNMFYGEQKLNGYSKCVKEPDNSKHEKHTFF